MPNLNIESATTTSMSSAVPDFSVQPKTLDEAGAIKETYWYNDKFTKYLGYLKQIPELFATATSLNMWAFGKGYTTDPRTKVILRRVRGWGEDTFDSIIMGLGLVADINGDAYAEIVRDEEADMLINLKPLNPQTVRHVVDSKGILIRYDVWNGKKWEEFDVKDILHICNYRIGNEIHGTSRIEPCVWVIDARNEAMRDKRRIMHRNSIRVIEVDADDSTKITALKTQWADAIKNGEVMIIPKDNVSFPDVKPLTTAEHSEWIRYLETFYYKSFGVPEVILGGAQEYTEAGSKIGYLTFEVPSSVKARQMEQDILAQLGYSVEFERPPSLKDDVQTAEAANTGQLGIQPNEVTAQMGRVE